MPRGTGPGPRGPYMNRTHCKYGHEFTEENTYWYASGNSVTRICRTCIRERSTFRKRLYGMSLDDYHAALAAQGGVCAICGESSKGRALAVDHDHASGNVRSLLCNGCNVGLAQFRHDPILLQKAIRYLAQWKHRLEGQSGA
jgi:hypothetical protein